MVRLFKLWLPVALWCSMIFYLSSISDLSTGWGLYDFVLRKIAHMVEYGILAFLVWRALLASGTFTENKVYSLSFVFSVLYAVSDEIHQGFVPGRGPSVYDVLIDAIGVVIAICIIMFVKQKKGVIQNEQQI